MTSVYLEARFGGRRALLTDLKYRLLLGWGAFDHLLAVDWPRVHRLVFVCAGNICRSPYAARRASDMGCVACSFGLLAEASKEANPSARRNALRRNVDLAEHRAACATDFTPQSGDLLVGFEPWHCAEVLNHFAQGSGFQVTLCGLWSRPRFPYIHDPYGRSDAYFQACFGRIDSAIQAMVRERSHARR